MRAEEAVEGDPSEELSATVSALNALAAKKTTWAVAAPLSRLRFEEDAARVQLRLLGSHPAQREGPLGRGGLDSLSEARPLERTWRFSPSLRLSAQRAPPRVSTDSRSVQLYVHSVSCLSVSEASDATLFLKAAPLDLSPVRGTGKQSSVRRKGEPFVEDFPAARYATAFCREAVVSASLPLPPEAQLFTSGAQIPVRAVLAFPLASCPDVRHGRTDWVLCSVCRLAQQSRAENLGEEAKRRRVLCLDSVSVRRRGRGMEYWGSSNAAENQIGKPRRLLASRLSVFGEQKTAR